MARAIQCSPPKGLPASPWIFRLLHYATRSINEEEESKLKAILTLIHGITTDEEFEDHFFHNKEYWYRRVRMPFKEGMEASAGILSILEFMKTKEGFQEFVTEKLEAHFVNWAKRCRGVSSASCLRPCVQT